MFSVYLQAFERFQPLRQRVLHVLSALPKKVQQDFVTDTCFTVLLDNYVPGEGSSVFMAAPDASGISSRSVVLRPRLSECEVVFAYYAICALIRSCLLAEWPVG